MESTNAKIKEEPEYFDSTEFGFDYDSIMQSELFEEGDNHSELFEEGDNHSELFEEGDNHSELFEEGDNHKGNGESFVNQDGNEGTQLNYRHHYHYRCRVFILPN